MNQALGDKGALAEESALIREFKGTSTSRLPPRDKCSRYAWGSPTSSSTADKAEIESVAGSDDYSAFVGTATDLLLVMHPEIGEGVRGLDAGPRAKLFDDAMQASTDKSSELQNQNKDGGENNSRPHVKARRRYPYEDLSFVPVARRRRASRRREAVLSS